MIIAIDGPAGSGKTTTARKVAQILGFIHINTGAMYRGIALKFIREKVNLDNASAIERILNNTRLDFAGPIAYKKTVRTQGKAYIIIYTCSAITITVRFISSTTSFRPVIVQVSETI